MVRKEVVGLTFYVGFFRFKKPAKATVAANRAASVIVEGNSGMAGDAEGVAEDEGVGVGEAD